jgi:hypothetical protein
MKEIFSRRRQGLQFEKTARDFLKEDGAYEPGIEKGLVNHDGAKKRTRDRTRPPDGQASQ